MTHLSRITTAALLTATLTGCSSNDDYTPKTGMAAADIFAEACESCHGAGGGGKFGFLLKVTDTDASPAKVAQHIANGGPVMSGFPNIPESDRLALAGYLKAGN